MREAIKKVLPPRFLESSRPARYKLRRIALNLRNDSALSPIQRLYRDGYHEFLTKNLPLTEKGIAVDFGGYHGEWAADIVREYGCQVHVFEPVAEFVLSLTARFKGDSRVIIHPCAIGQEGGSRNFQLSQDGTGGFAEGSTVPVRFESAEFLSQLLPEAIDVVSINIEGGEYELIPALHAENLLERFKLIFVQFHRVDGIPDVDDERKLCQELLAENHQLQWSYDFVWEAWLRR